MQQKGFVKPLAFRNFSLLILAAAICLSITSLICTRCTCFYIHETWIGKKKFPSADLMCVMREKERRKWGGWGGNYIQLFYFCFKLLYWEGVFLPYRCGCLSAQVKAQLHVPKKHLFYHKHTCCSWPRGMAWPNCSLFGNHVSHLWDGLLLSLHFLPLHFWVITSNGFQVGLYFSFHFHVWPDSSLFHSNYCLRFRVTFGSPNPTVTNTLLFP